MSNTTRKIMNIMFEHNVGIEELTRKIISKHPKGLGNICYLDRVRVNEIFRGDSPTFLETILIIEALGESVSVFFK